MRTIFFSILLAPVLMITTSYAMVGRSITKQDRIMNEAMKAINFNDTVRGIETTADGSLKITFLKHSAIYTMDSIKADSLIKKLEHSRVNKKPLVISILPDNNKIVHVE